MWWCFLHMQQRHRRGPSLSARRGEKRARDFISEEAAKSGGLGGQSRGFSTHFLLDFPLKHIDTQWLCLPFMFYSIN